MDLGLAGRKALVTGGSRGIGKAIAQALAAEGVRVAIPARDPDAAKGVIEEMANAGGPEGFTCALDLTAPESIGPAVQACAEALGGLDILINCAGGAYRALFEDVPDDVWERTFSVKPFGLVRVSREALPHLKRSDQPRIINISGTRGREPSPVSSVSGPVNFATLSLTKVMANALGPSGITVNAINPGSTETRRWDELVEITQRNHGLDRAAAEKHLLTEVPMGKVVRVQDIADLAVFLASARAGMISGTAINVDGGRTRSI